MLSEMAKVIGDADISFVNLSPSLLTSVEASVRPSSAKIAELLARKPGKEVKGLTKFLDDAAGLQIEMAIGTSAPRSNVDFVLKRTGIGKYFSAILDESHVNHGKPNPEIYINCAAALNYPTSKCIVFEDSLSGVAAGRAAGSQVVGVATTHTPEELGTKVVIKDFTEITPSQLQREFKS